MPYKVFLAVVKARKPNVVVSSLPLNPVSPRPSQPVCSQSQSTDVMTQINIARFLPKCGGVVCGTPTEEFFFVSLSPERFADAQKRLMGVGPGEYELEELPPLRGAYSPESATPDFSLSPSQ